MSIISQLTNKANYSVSEFEDTKAVSAEEPSSGSQRLSFKVLRTYGRVGAVKVAWSISSLVSDIRQDISQMEGHVGFLTNENEATINLDVVSDALPELNEVGVIIEVCSIH